MDAPSTLDKVIAGKQTVVHIPVLDNRVRELLKSLLDSGNRSNESLEFKGKIVIYTIRSGAKIRFKTPELAVEFVQTFGISYYNLHKPSEYMDISVG